MQFAFTEEQELLRREARDALGYRPRTTLAAGLRKLVRWLDGRVAIDRVSEARAALASRGLTL